MNTLGNRRVGWPLIGALLAGLMAAVVQAAPAAAGAGCHDSHVSDESGAAVALTESCFTPTILRAASGARVTWKNADSYGHTVTGVGESWGSYDEILPGESVTYRFQGPGVYLYFCVIHPGMVGAVVVGDGGSPGDGALKAVAAAASPSPPGTGEPARGRAVAAKAPTVSTNLWPFVGLGVALFLGLAVLLGGRYRRPRLSGEGA